MTKKLGRPRSVRPICPQCRTAPLKRKRDTYCGKPCSNAARARSAADRFEDYVVRKPEGCWGWRGPVASNGYPIITDDGRQQTATRVSWRIHRGETPPQGSCVMHACDNPPCTNPEHLRIGTQQENVDDMIGKGRMAMTNSQPDAPCAKKLTSANVREIRTLYKDFGIRAKDLAARFDVTPAAIFNVIAGRTWRHI